MVLNNNFKKMKKRFWFAIGALVLSSTAATLYLKDPTAVATSAATGYEIGATVADFKLKNVDGNTVTLSDYKDKKGAIVVFTCNHCPFAKAYEDRIMELDKKYAPLGYPVLAVQPNDPVAYEEDSFERMKARAKEKGYTFPYMIDDNQAVAKAFGAARTPHVFILKNNSGKFNLEYTGTIDDNAQDPAGVTKRYVEDAVSNLLGGKPVVTTTTKAVGCAIRWKDA